MAENNDGSITFDTELDNTGFEKGSEKMLQAIKDVTASVDNMGDNMMESFSKMLPLLTNIANSTSLIAERITGAATQAAEANTEIASSEQQVVQAAQAAAEAVGQEQQAATDFSTGALNMKNTTSQLEREVNSLAEKMQSISSSTEAGFSNGKAVLTFDAKLSDIENKLASAREKLAQFGATKIPTEDYQQLSKQIEKTEQSLFKLYDRRDEMKDLGVKSKSKAWQRLALDIKNTETELDRYERQQAAMENNGTAFVQGTNTGTYAQMEQSLNNTEAALARNKALIDAEALAQARLNVQVAQEKVNLAETESERQTALANLQAAQQELNNVASSMSMKGGNMGPGEGAISGWERLARTVSSFGAAAKVAAAKAAQLIAHLSKAAFNTFTKGVKNAINGLKNYASQAKQTILSSNALVKSLTSVKTLLKTRIKRMFISAIINSVKDSLNELAKFSSEFDKSMSSITNSSKRFSGNLAVSLSGLINAVAPALTQLMDMLSRVATYFNAFIAMLSGKSTMIVAKKQTASYAASLDKTADSTDKAAEATKEYNKQVYGFDELNRRSDNSSTSDKGASGSDGSDLFEEVPISSVLPDTIKQFLDELKALVDAGDWFGVGEKLASGLNSIVDTVDNWINSTFRPKGVEWAGNFAEILNGLVYGFNWTNLGATLGDGINAIADIFNTFLTKFDFEALGTGVANGFNGLFDRIEWDLLGQTFANYWNALVSFIYGLVTNLDWANVGDSFAEFVQNAINTFNFEKLADTISNGINGIVTLLQHFFDGVDWDGLGTTLGNGVNRIFGNTDWTALGQSISTAINSLVSIILNFVDTVDWSGAGAKLAASINAIFTNTDWAALGKTLSDAFSGVLQFIITAIEEIDWIGIGRSIIDFLLGIDWIGLVGTLVKGIIDAFFACCELIAGGIAEVLLKAWDSITGWWRDVAYEDGKFTIMGLLEGILDIFKDIGSWLYDNIAKPFIDGFKKLFGINSPSTVMAELGGFLIEGLLNGISGLWSSITDFFSDAGAKLKDKISGLWDNIKTKTSESWGKIKDTVSDKFTQLKTSLQNIGDNIKTKLSSTWDNIKTKSSDIWGKVKQTVGDKFTQLKTSLQNTGNNIKTTISNVWTNVNSTASQKWSTIKSTVSRLWSGLKTTLSTTDWHSVGSNLVSGLRAGISNAWSGLTSFVSGLASGLTSTLRSAFSIHSPSKVWAQIGEYLDAGLMQGINAKRQTVLNTVSKLAHDATDQLTENKATLQIDTTSDKLLLGLSTIADKLSDIASIFHSIGGITANLPDIQIPAIITGAEIPYKTRISDSGTGATNVLAMSSDLDEVLSAQNYILQQIFDLLSRLHLTVDGDSLMRALTSLYRLNGRNYGGV